MYLYPKFLVTILIWACSTNISQAIITTNPSSQQQTTGNTALTYSSPQVPESVVFCGKKIDLTRFDRHERMDRELLAFTYMHSTSIQMIKKANRYFPIVEPRIWYS